MTILNLYPDLLHTNGCVGSALALQSRLKWRDIDVEVPIFTTADKEFPSNSVDFMIIGDGTQRETSAVIRHLKAFAPQIKEYIEEGGVLFASGSGFQILGAIGVLDITFTPAKSRIIGDILVQTELFEEVIIGFENHATEIDIGDYQPLGKVMRGVGNSSEGERDGLIYKNIICTNAGGPTLAKNPQLCDYLIQKVVNVFTVLDDAIENEARQFTLNFLEETENSAQSKCIEI